MLDGNHDMFARQTPAQRYLDLLKRCLTRYDLEDPLRYEPYRTHRTGLGGRVRLAAQAALRRRGLEIVRPLDPVSLEEREVGKDWPRTAETMIGLRRLDNIQACVEDVLERGIPGDLIETGAWRGGSCIFMRAILAIHDVTDRTVWVADSFQGLPRPDAHTYPGDAGDRHWMFTELAVPLEEVQTNFRRYGLLDDQVRFLAGWFRDTLPTAPIEQLAVLRLDGDMYESTIQALEALYHKVAVGGYVIIDDYHAVRGCKEAVDDFRRDRAIDDELIPIDWGAVYWKRSNTVDMHDSKTLSATH